MANELKTPCGNGVNKPQEYSSVSNIISTKSADTTNSSVNILDTTTSGENLSAKFKNGSQDMAPEARNQYM